MRRVRTVGVEAAMRPMPLLATSLALVLAAAPALAAPSRPCRVDRAQYTALTSGMSYDRVSRLIGCAGRRVSHLNIGQIHRATYSWRARGTYGANVTLTFRNHRLTDKAQLGLD